MNQAANQLAVTPARIYSRYQDSADVVQSLKPDGPLYLFSAHTLEQRARRFINHFPGVISYAIKANPRNRVLRTLSNTGIGHFDVASISEVAHASQSTPQQRYTSTTRSKHLARLKPPILSMVCALSP